MLTPRSDDASDNPHPIEVTFFNRADVGGVSIERLFHDIRAHMPPTVLQHSWRARFGGTNPLKVLWNILSARYAQQGINHVTGDAHYLCLLLNGRRTVLTVHDCVGLERLEGWRRAIFWLLWYRLPLAKVGAVVAISEQTRRDILNYVNVDPGKIHLVENCISQNFQPSMKPFNRERPTVLQVGTGWNKNLLRVAEALTGLPCQLRIIGELDADMHHKLEALGVDYTVSGRIDDEQLVREYQSCDLLVFASIYEGFGLPIAEAQATGKPVVTSCQEPMCSVAGAGGAELVDPTSVDSIRLGVKRIIDNEDYRVRLVKKGLENATRFRPERAASEYLSIYRRLHKSA